MKLVLTEWEPTELRLNSAQAVELRSLPARIAVEPIGAHGIYRATPGSYVGSVRSPNFELVIRPKFDVRRLLFLLGYAPPQFTAGIVKLQREPELTETMVRMMAQEVSHALGRGPLMGYRRREESANTIRGRIRIGDQLRSRYTIPLPIEVGYDDFTVDVEENRVLLAALMRAERLRLDDRLLRRRLHELVGALEGVTPISYTYRGLPEIHRSRRNHHYAPALDLARAVIGATSAELQSGDTRTPSFLVNMNSVFERAVFGLIGEQLDLPPRYRWRHGRRLSLDRAGRVPIKPDLSLWHGKRCLFVGDAKYKRTELGENADLYQLLAYCKATGVDSGLLIYADPGMPAAHEVILDGTRLFVGRFSIDGDGTELRTVAADVAQRIRVIARIGRAAA